MTTDKIEKAPAVQYFSTEYLQQCTGMTPAQTIKFLDDFRRLHGARVHGARLHGARQPAKSKLISLKVPQDLLDAFRSKADMVGVRYQSQIKVLIRAWLDAEDR